MRADAQMPRANEGRLVVRESVNRGGKRNYPIRPLCTAARVYLRDDLAGVQRYGTLLEARGSLTIRDILCDISHARFSLFFFAHLALTHFIPVYPWDDKKR